jgi:hypothetical protein
MPGGPLSHLSSSRADQQDGTEPGQIGAVHSSVRVQVADVADAIGFLRDQFGRMGEES